MHCFAALANAAKMAMPAGQELIQVKKLSDNAALPVRGSKHAAGFDLSRQVTRAPSRHTAVALFGAFFTLRHFCFGSSSWTSRIRCQVLEALVF